MIPVTAYYRNAAYGLGVKRKEGGITITSYILLMVPTTAYPNEAAIKSLFYLDYVEYCMKEVVGGVTYIGARVGVLVGGTNASMRSVGRLSGLKEKIKIGGADRTVEWLNDGGLHTFPFSNQPSILTENSLRGKFSIEFRSAFYFDSTDLGYIIKNNNSTPDFETDVIVQLSDFLGSNISQVKTNISVIAADAWQTYYIYSYHRNIEGLYISPVPRQAYLNGDPIILAYQTTQPTNSGEVVGFDETYYTNADTSNGFPGNKVSSASSSFNVPMDGWFVSRVKERWYRVTAGFITDQGSYSDQSGTVEYKFYRIATLSCAATVEETITLQLDSPPIITSGVPAPLGLAPGIYRTQATINTGSIFNVYQTFECPGGGIDCDESEKIVTNRIGTVTEC